MASFLDKFKIKTATNERTKMDLSCDHITSTDFMLFNSVYNREMVPKEKLVVNVETFTRMEPLVVPTFGRANVKNRAFFVPYRTIFPGWDDFITDTSHVLANGSPERIMSTSVPVIDQEIFWSFMLVGLVGSDPLTTVVPEPSGTFTLAKWVEDNPHAFDYIVTYDHKDTGTTATYMKQQYPKWESANGYPIKLTAYGRQVMKIMNSLGYVFNTYVVSTPVNGQLGVTAKYSALPLLALAKVYSDWFMPTAYDTKELDYLFRRDVVGDYYTLSAADLMKIFSYITRVSYDSDYFVSAWDRPNAPNSGSIDSAFNIPDINLTNGSTASFTSDGNAPTLSVGSGTGRITKFGLDALNSLSDYLKRHQLAGSRSIDRFLARFGVTLDAAKVNRSVYLGQDQVPLQIGDVTSMADTINTGNLARIQGASLGSFAGKGIGYGQKSFEYTTDEYGMFIITSTIIPSIDYYQGVDRNVLHVTRTDFWTPEFDSLGTQAIGKNEVYLPIVGGTGFYYQTGDQLDSYDSLVFGFTPRYAECKVGRSRLTGDKRYNSMAVGQDSWHLMRQLEFGNKKDVVHNIDFVRGYETYPELGHEGMGDYAQYNRIFQNTETNADHFNMIYHFNVTSWNPMSPLYDNYEWKDHDKGQDVRMDVNGVKMN